MSTERNDLNELEARLASLAPSASRTNRDRAMYLAGYAAAKADAARSRRPSVWLWPASTAAMAVVAVSLGAWLALERQSGEIAAESDPSHSTSPDASRDAERESPVVDGGAGTVVADNGSSRSWPSPPHPSYLRIRERVLLEGVDALPPSESSGGNARRTSWTPRSHPQFSELLEG